MHTNIAISLSRLSPTPAVPGTNSPVSRLSHPVPTVPRANTAQWSQLMLE